MIVTREQQRWYERHQSERAAAVKIEKSEKTSGHELSPRLLSVNDYH